MWVFKLLLAGAESCLAQLRCGEEREMVQRRWDFNTLIPTKYFKRPTSVAGAENRELKESRGGQRIIYTVFPCL